MQDILHKRERRLCVRLRASRTATSHQARDILIRRGPIAQRFLAAEEALELLGGSVLASLRRIVMQDIEELDLDVGLRTQTSPSLIFPRSSNPNPRDCEEDASSSSQQRVPGTGSVWVRTFGCSHNVSDSEYMEGMLLDYGYSLEKRADDAELWLINSCTVKDPSQAAFMHLVTKAKQEGKKVVVAGCVPQADQKIPGLEDVSVVGIAQIDRVVEVVEQTFQGSSVQLLQKKALPRLDLPKVRKNPLVEIIPLSTGCLGACTYCKTRHARGKLGSYSPEAIVDRAKAAISEGVAEIWLSSEDTGAYGRDIGTNIGELLRSLISVVPEKGVMLRIGMTNPPYILEHLEVVAEILRSPKVFSFLHVPVQAGSNRVLDAMRREYTVEEFRRVADYLIANVPDMTIATDIICGFPGETEADFEFTMQLMRHYRLAVVNISQFYPRPGTPASKMKRIDTQVVKNRSRRLTTLFESFTPYAHLPGKTVMVYFNTEVSDDGGHSVGHTKSYVKVLVPLDPSLPGKAKLVELKQFKRFHVEGVCCAEEVPGQGERTTAPLRRWPPSSWSLAFILGVGGVIGLAFAAVRNRRR